MKLSFVLSTSPTKFKALTQTSNLEGSLKRLSSLGYDGVELAISDPDIVDIKNLVRLVNKYNLDVPAIATGQTFVEEGLNLSDASAEIRKKAIKRLKRHIETAGEFGAIVIIGLVQGNVKKGEKLKDVENRFIDNLGKCLDFAKRLKIRMVLEPVNRYENGFVHSAEYAMSLLRRCPYDNCGLLLDTFHMNIEEKDIYKTIISSRKFLWHVHISDSNRWAPGQGHLDFRKIIETLKALQYVGYLSAEILPIPDSDNAMQLTIEHIGCLGYKIFSDRT